VWTLDYSLAAERDFELIFDHLFETYVTMGEDPAFAIDHAGERLRAIRSSIDDLVKTPFIGTLRADILPDLRFVRRDQAAVWFVPSPAAERIVVAAVFFGAQDHIRKMLTRLLAEWPET